MGNGWKIATAGLAVLVVALGSSLALLWHHLHGTTSQGSDQGPLEHVSNGFDFVLHAPMAQVAPLFGAEHEKVWGGKDWQPEFLYPSQEARAKDVEGAVFRVRHGQRRVPWVNTAFDLAAGHIAYVYVVDAHMVTRIDIRLAPQDANATRIKVLYERTALSSAANDHVAELGKEDARSGPVWQAQLEAYLEKTSNSALAASPGVAAPTQ